MRKKLRIQSTLEQALYKNPHKISMHHKLCVYIIHICRYALLFTEYDHAKHKENGFKFFFNIIYKISVCNKHKKWFHNIRAKLL